MKTIFLVGLFVLAQAGYLVAYVPPVEDDACEGEDVDVLLLLELSIYASASATVSLNVSTEADVKVQIDIEIKLLISVDLQITTSPDDNPGLPSFPGGGVTVQNLYNYYYDVCPALYFRVPYWKFYFWVKGECCWPINDIWIPKCVCNFCKLRPYTYDIYYPWLRCVQEYRWKYIPSICWTRSGYRVRYLRRYLPVGCCCKSYWTYGLVQQKQCVAIG